MSFHHEADLAMTPNQVRNFNSISFFISSECKCTAILHFLKTKFSVYFLTIRKLSHDQISSIATLLNDGKKEVEGSKSYICQISIVARYYRKRLDFTSPPVCGRRQELTFRVCKLWLVWWLMMGLKQKLRGQEQPI